MSSQTDDARLIEFGKQVRQRREALRISVRKLANAAGISPSYVTAIESGRNPATGRPPEPSIGVVERLSSALDLSNLVFAVDIGEGAACCDHNHTLLYRLDDGRRELREVLGEVFQQNVQQWICICDPRTPYDSDETLVAWHWRFGDFPYPDNYLVPERIGEALEAELTNAAAKVTAENYGLVIADCSAVMRWMINPDAEVDYEDRWLERSTDVCCRLLGRPPVTNVCVYSHRDLEALSRQIDVLDTVLRLLTAHSDILAIEGSGTVLAGTEAVLAVLAECRPGGVSGSAWRSMSHAAARSYGRMQHR